MNGILVVNKEKGYTSRDVVNIVSKKLGTKKVGHTGTLDPLAEGVLVLCIGNCLKLVELLMSNRKEYIAKVRLGIETDTLDITGNVTQVFNDFSVTKNDIIKVLNSYIGNIRQEVPLYSAVKVNGKKLYEYARKNVSVSLPVKNVCIYELELLGDVIDNCFYIRCCVSKGTYIRSLIRDIGKSLGIGATMLELVRVKQGDFSIDDAYSLDDISNNKFSLLNPIDVIDLPRVVVRGDMVNRIRNGQVLKKFFSYDKAFILDNNGNLLAIYQVYNGSFVKPYKMFL